MTTLQRIAAMCGNPDAAEGCRQILKVVKHAIDYEKKWDRMLEEFQGLLDGDEPVSGSDLVEWISNELE